MSTNTRTPGLPHLLTRFIGRQDEVETIISLLEQQDVRLITLTGPGGIGKSRLALEVAHQMDARQDHDIAFVTLTTVDRTDLVFPTIGDRLGMLNSHQGQIVDRLAGFLDQAPTLLVLDNLEHVIDVAPDLSRLLSQTSNLQILATSRSPLRIQGEREYSVPHLSIPGADARGASDVVLNNESIALFLDRAQSINQEFNLDDSNIDAVIEICERLEGVPLAIELAAARTRVLPPQALLERLNNQLDLLKDNTRDRQGRLQTIRATIEWSYDLLQDNERRAFRQLAVLAGDFPLDAAAAVLDVDETQAIEILESMIDKSLVHARTPQGSAPYYRILAATREFGLEKLTSAGEYSEIRSRHAEYFATLAESLYEGQFGSDQAQVLDRLARNHPNIRQALTWALEQNQLELAARIAGNIWQFWNVRAHLNEGCEYTLPIIRADAQLSPSLKTRLYYGAVILLGNTGEVDAANRLAHDLLALGEESGDTRMIATGCQLVAMTEWDTPNASIPLRAYQLWLELDEPVWSGIAASEVSRRLRELGEIEQAGMYAHAGEELLQSSGHLWGYAQILLERARIERLYGNHDAAKQLVFHCLTTLSGLDDRILLVRCFETLRQLVAEDERDDCVIVLMHIADRLRESIGFGIRHPREQSEAEQARNRAMSRLGRDRSEEYRAFAERLTVGGAIDYALSIQFDSDDATTRASTRDSDLSQRELDVLCRVARGKTDQEIADELFVSYRTVTTHVRNILNKLNAGSRAEAAAIAARYGLLEEQ